jgi:nitrogenase molybdenum-iron protein alpha chain
MDDEHLGLGYRGLVRYGRKISNWIRNPSIERTLARHNPPPYTRWWLERHPHHFLGVNKDE